MKRGECLSLVRGQLTAAGIEEAPLESELLVRHALNLSQVGLYLCLEQELTSDEAESLWPLVRRRLDGEPAAYILGQREFYGLDFYVNPSVLIPRPETELLLEKAIALGQDYEAPVMADIGTGCGAIAVSLAVNLSRARIYATDISVSALEVARANARRYGVENRITFLQGDLLGPLPVSVDLLLANLPYVKSLNVGLSFEPHVALDGGPDGLALISRLCGMLGGKLRLGGSVLLEVGLGQAEAVAEHLKAALPLARFEVIPDLAGIGRLVSAVLPSPVRV